MPKARIYVVDDHPLILIGLCEEIRRQPDFTLVGQARDAQTALAALRQGGIDLVTIDLELGNSSGLDLLKDMTRHGLKIKTLVVSMHDTPDIALRAIRAGALGFMSKQDSVRNLSEAIRCVLAGVRYLTPPLSEQFCERYLNGQAGQDSPLESLTNRELQIVKLISQALETSDIAATLHISASTVLTHCASIKLKLAVTTEKQLIVAAARLCGGSFGTRP